jgi:hypothetical protein
VHAALTDEEPAGRVLLRGDLDETYLVEVVGRKVGRIFIAAMVLGFFRRELIP